MRYVGGKSRLAKSIAEAVQSRRAGRSKYIEPFMGGGATFARMAPMFDQASAGDVVEDLVLLWTAARNGWEPPTDVDDTLYNTLRDAGPSPVRGFVGFGCSFGGKWFGGRAKGGYNADGTPRNHAAESARAVLRLAPKMHGTDIRLRGYQDWTPDADTVVYCDPPYAGTQAYGAAGAFDSAMFWKTAESWVADGALVLVSEYEAPDGWVPVLTREHRQSLQHGKEGRPKTTETLWVHVSQL
ncbi:DNA adenine methylase [Streptomyces sp. NBC_01571]|uniref:DNA adenine methylase n=1 Tax=Streptomyces sp. NBC_01571 TaxID=2975883 RepID=UPI00225107DB|nr:DNA adenine methylase [Streptomyces sp. NBC_01571]MCX4572305.1 DNA adenine methylase [Streptomyces sp. NBC_01571]